MRQNRTIPIVTTMHFRFYLPIVLCRLRNPQQIKGALKIVKASLDSIEHPNLLSEIITNL